MMSTQPLEILGEVFGYDSFRGPQQDIISHVIAGGDALVLMPTGGGKSLCYQIPAIARHRAGLGVTVVVSPLIALMHDQVGALLEAGVAAAFLNSSLSLEQAQQVQARLQRAELTLLYVAPERLERLKCSSSSPSNPCTTWATSVKPAASSAAPASRVRWPERQISSTGRLLLPASRSTAATNCCGSALISGYSYQAMLTTPGGRPTYMDSISMRTSTKTTSSRLLSHCQAC